MKTGTVFAVVTTLLAALACTQAQKLSAPPPAKTVTLGQSIVALNGPWKFHIGDNPKWADPNFDDSHWETVDLTARPGSFDPSLGSPGYVPGWTAKGHSGYWGYAWYRIRVQVAARPGQRLAMAGPADADDVYQVFANGTLLGSFGKFPSHGHGSALSPVVYQSRPRMFLLPTPGGYAPATQVLAFRVWMEPSTLLVAPDAGGLHEAPRLGDAAAVDAHYRLAWLELVRAHAADVFLAAMFFLLALLACSLILFDRSDPVYRWLAAVFLLTAIVYATVAVGAWTQVGSADTMNLVQFALLNPLILGGWAMVWWVWFRMRRPTWIPKAIAVLTLLYMVSAAIALDFLFTVVPHPVGVAFHLVPYVIARLLLLLLAIIVVLGVRQQGKEGWLALPAIVLLGVAYFPNQLVALGVPVYWFPFGAQVSLTAISDVAFAVAIFVLLLRRLQISIRHQREMTLDVKQAAEVQHVLIPNQLPQIPGLAIESEYLPATEVGGDFFQIVPHPSDGSALIVVGDVTGHGLQAGMLVALIVGAIRNQTETSFDPLSMLQSLNRRLMGRGQAHATCLALRIYADGAATLTNAGHLPPYLNGKELPMEGSLPLGMIDDAEFSVMQFQLHEEDRLILMSDGVVEAQNEHGHLFGFERVEELLRHPITAARLATAAQNFGQEDDILVLGIQRVPQTATMPSPEPILATI